MYSSRDIHKGEALFFEKKLQLAQVIQKQIQQLPENYEEELRKCFLNFNKIKRFEKSSINQFMNENTGFSKLLANGNIGRNNQKKANLIEVLDKEFSVDYFDNKDVQLMIYFFLDKKLKDYNEEEKIIEYAGALEAIEQYDNNRKNVKNNTLSKKDNSNDLILIEVSDEEGAVIEEIIIGEESQDSIKNDKKRN